MQHTNGWWLHTTERSRGRSRSRNKKKRRRRKLNRKLRTDRKTHAMRRHARSRNHLHKHRVLKEVETVNALLTQLLQTASSTENKPYHYDKRHPTKDPEYAWSSAAVKSFKDGFPAPDVHFWRPQSETLPPSRGNFPDWHQMAD